MVPEKIIEAVKVHVSHLRRQLQAAEDYLRVLEEDNATPAHGRGNASQRKAHAFAQDGLTHREYIRDLLRKHDAEGLTPSEICSLAQKDGRKVSKSFPYEQLSQMRKDKEVKKSGPKYFPVKAPETKVAAVA